VKHPRKAAVSERAILARINRKLASDKEAIRKSRSAQMRASVGQFYRIDLMRNFISGQDIDLTRFAKELGVLRPWEEILG